MAGGLKEKQISRRMYSNLQSLGCPLVDGLYLREDESMRDLLCTPSLHRTDILKWICISICPSLNKKFSAQQSTRSDAVDREILEFAQELMLCKPGDLDLIKGVASPSRQLVFLEQLLSLVPSPAAEGSSGHCSSSGTELSAAELVLRNDELLGELLSPAHVDQLGQLLSPTCSPWTADLRDLLHRHTAHYKTGCYQSTEDVAELLQSTQALLEDLRAQCEFLRADPTAAPLSPSALRVAVSDLSQLMSAFSQTFNTDFRGYCHRSPPALSPNTHIFQTIHRLLSICNQELQAFQQLSDTCGTATKTVQRILTDQCYWGNGHRHTLSARVTELKRRYSQFVSLCE